MMYGKKEYVQAVAAAAYSIENSDEPKISEEALLAAETEIARLNTIIKCLEGAY